MPTSHFGAMFSAKVFSCREWLDSFQKFSAHSDEQDNIRAISFEGALVYEEVQDEYPVYEEDEIRKRRKSLLYTGVGLLVFAAIGASLAQTITLNTTGRVEFGQGVVTLKACDSFISISLSPSSATFSGTRANGSPYVNASRVKNIRISSLDTRACAGKRIKIQLFDNLNAGAMNLFTDADSIAVDKVILVIDPNGNIDRADAVTLLNGKGQNIGYFDAYQFLDFDPDRATYTLIFSSPLALMSDVYRLTIESTA